MINKLNSNTEKSGGQNMIEAAIKYALEGYYIFPCNTDKTPKTPRGFHDASKDISVIEAWWKKWPDANIGLPTGAKNGIIVLDIDPKNGGDLDEQIGRYLDIIPSTLKIETPSGTHLYFKYPKGKIVKTHKLGGHAGLDVRSNGAYVIAPPSVCVTKECPNGGEYSVRKDLPIAEWPFGEHKEIDPKVSYISGNSTIDPDEIRSALDALDPDMGYEDWIRVLMAVHSEYPGHLGFDMADHWSAPGEKYLDNEISKKWNSFKPNGKITINTLFKMANDTGWRWESKGDCVVVDNAPEPEIEDWPVFPKYLLKGNGIIDDVAKYTLSQSIKLQPTLAFGAALSFISTAIGQIFCSSLNTRSNIFVIGVSGTATGKNAPRKAIDDLLDSIMLGHRRAGEEPASGAGLVKRVARENNTLYLLDEFADLIREIKTGGNYKSDVLSIMMKIFTASNMKYKATDYATKENEFEDIICPYMSAYAMTTPEHFFEAIGSSDVSSGFLNRCLFIKGIDRPKRNKKLNNVVPSTVKEWYERYMHSFPKKFGSQLSGLTVANPLVFKFSHEAESLSDEFYDEIENIIYSENATEMIKQIHGRDHEKAIKVALILACADIGNKVHEPIIEKRHIERGIAFVRYSTAVIKYGLNNIKIASKFDHDCEIIINAMKKFKGGWVTRKQLSDHIRKVDRKDREKLFQVLREDGLLDEVIERTKTRPIKKYKLL